ncbi:MAG: AEC family transporter [Eubacteriales bacterium]|nr:AEC family transporter [Eubacteriales bacterium]
MIGNILTVGQQVFILFLLMIVGWALGKLKMIDDASYAGITNLALYLIIPCTMIQSFQFTFSKRMLLSFFLCGGISLAAHLSYFFLSRLFVRSKDQGDKKVLVMLAMFANCNFMGIPLLVSVLGKEGVFYGSAYAVVNPVLIWTLGQIYMSGSKSGTEIRKALVNPSTIGILIGLFLFITGLSLPKVVNTCIGYLAGMAVPLPMLLVGYMLCNLDLRKMLKDIRLWQGISLRIVFFPVLTLLILYLVGIRGDMLTAITIEAACPGATLIVLLSSKYKCNDKLAAALCSVSTIFSVLTMPVIVGIAQNLA